jgi:tetratricopeptide (TPR) repeat protein
MIGIAISVRDWRRYELPRGIGGALIVSVLLTYNFGRFRIGMMPVWILFAAAGLVWLASSLRNPGWQRGLALVCLGGLAAVTVAAFQHPPNYPTYSRQLSGFRTLVLQQAEARRNVVELEKRLARDPDQPELHSLLARALTGVGRLDEARQHHQRAMEGNPSDATLRLHWAEDLLATGHAAEAIPWFQQALEMDPALGGKVHYRLARAYRELEEIDQAIHHLRLAAQADPGAAGPAYNLAVLLVTHPDADMRRRFAGEAASWAEKAWELRQGQNPQDLHVLAAAYAEQGRFDNAVATAERGMELARRTGNADLGTLLEADRDRFRQGLTARLRPAAP